MSFITAVAQYAPNDNKEENLNSIEALVREAHKKGARLIVLPEYAIYTVSTMDDRFVENAELLGGPSVTKIASLSLELNVAIVFGINEKASEDRIHNTLIGIEKGEVSALYRKVHLYDAFGYRESDKVIAAEPNNGSLLSVEGMNIGMQTCYDLRFPEVTRALVDSGADIIALPAEWIPGPLKEYHWNTLIRARAIENTVFILAADQSAPNGVGNSAIIDPMGITLASVGENSGVALAELSNERLGNVRKINPALTLRRYKVVGK
ncbi:carbon-nitrogen hydrolase family protein [Marinomonas foliarum]|uniref:Putative amidohydrolase n=1 Tax=Marinomonas foliarum TaxID=491950 RepID=A0A368ZTI2_9GAMM|nr:carbon-nitrogen hydrolase family protein [Marinomonas foliarum]RCW99647.1 putative amidohydrolase [Marinomonas foliarum]